jgi:hypothetical protein
MDALDPARLELFDDKFSEDQSIPTNLARFVREHRTALPGTS